MATATAQALRVMKVSGNSRSVEEARARVFDFFKLACRSLPAVMDIYNLDDVVTKSQLRSAITSQIRKNSHITNAKILSKLRRGERKKGRRTRVCIEVDASLPLINQFQVVSHLCEEPITVEVSYEWRPSRCAKCKVFGHSCKVQEGLEEQKEISEEVENLAEKPANNGNNNDTSKEKEPTTIREIVPVPSENPGTDEPCKVLPSIHNRSNIGTEIMNPTESSDQPAQVTRASKGKQPMEHVPCMENKMDSISSGAMGLGTRKDYSSSSTSGKPPDSLVDSNSSTPKQKKRKGGKKKRDGAI